MTFSVTDDIFRRMHNKVSLAHLPGSRIYLCKFLMDPEGKVRILTELIVVRGEAAARLYVYVVPIDMTFDAIFPPTFDFQGVS